MWKIIVGFVIFAAIGMFVIIKGGDKLDMGGEKHGAEAIHAPESTASAPGVLNAPAAAASSLAAATAQAASATASAAK